MIENEEITNTGDMWEYKVVVWVAPASLTAI